MASGRTLSKNFFSLVALQGANYLLPLATLPYLARVLGAERFGLLAFATSLMQVFMVLVDYGFTLSATRMVAVHRQDHDQIQKIYGSVMWTNILLAVLGLMILVGACLVVPRLHQEWLVFLVAYGMVLGNAIFPVWLFQGMERMGYITLLNISSKMIFALAVFVIVHQPSHYLRAPAANSFGFLLAGGLAVFLGQHRYRLRLGWPDWNEIKLRVKESTSYFLSRISLTVYTSSNVMIMGFFLGNQAVGLFSAAERLYVAAQNVGYPLNTALYPHMAANRDVRLHRKIFMVVVALNTLACLLSFIWAPAMIRMIFGPAYQPSAAYLRVFLLAAMASVPSMLLGYPLLAALGHEKHANRSVMWGALFHLIGLALLVISGKLKPIFVVGTVLLTETIVLSLRLIPALKMRLWSSNNKFTKI